jgi:aspartyl/glutamyl-tRNA(Asn/Gln) amidotransferase, B subunit
MGVYEQYEIVVGLEVHAQLKTKSKLFCGDSTEFGLEPNTQISAVSLAYPGTLPVLNVEAIHMAIKLGLATNCEIIRHNFFARKNYFYPDLPKGYQISQHTTPICRNGFLEVIANGHFKKICINRIHMEEDAGKSVHGDENDMTLLDFNRAGMPLLEIVTEPDISSAEEAFDYVTRLRKLVRHLDVCDGNMEQGRLRCDVNISARKKGSTQLGTKVEIKNLNSIRFIKKAIEFERKRLIDLLEKGEKVVQQTRGFNEEDSTTYAIRTKEDEDDYRYFPEPDLPPFTISDELLNVIKGEMPLMENDLKKLLIEEYQLNDYDASQLSPDLELVHFFISVASYLQNNKAAANWVIGPVRNYLAANDLTIDEYPVRSSSIAQLIDWIDKGKMSHGVATQKVLPELINNPDLDLQQYATSNALFLISNLPEIDEYIDAALNKHNQKILEYKKGKKGLISLFVGEVMKLSKGKADAKIVTEKLIEKLKA